MPNGWRPYLTDDEVDEPDRRAFTQYVAGLPDLEGEQNQQRFRAAMADLPPPEPAPLSDLDRFRQRVGSWGAQLGASIGEQVGRVGADLGERTAGIRSALPGGEAWNADLERIRGERAASEQQFPTPVSALAQAAPVPPAESGPSAGLRPTRPLELPQSEAGTPEGERITSALAETAARGTPGGGLFAPGGLVGESLRHLAGQEPSVLLRRADRPRDWQEAFGRMGDPNDPRTQAFGELAFGATEAPRAVGRLVPRVAARAAAAAEARPWLPGDVLGTAAPRLLPRDAPEPMGGSPLRYSGVSLEPLTPTLYRQENAEQAAAWLPNTPRVGASGPTGATALDRGFAATTPDLALGQERNAGGVVLEFVTDRLTGGVSKRKPGWEFQYDQGNAEVQLRVLADHAQQLKDNLRSVTVPPGGVRPPEPGRLGRLRAQQFQERLDDLVRSRGWARVANADGSVTYRASEAGAAPPVGGVIPGAEAPPLAAPGAAALPPGGPPLAAPRAAAPAAAPTRAANITLTKFPPEVRGLLSRTATEAGDFLAQRRGTITDVQAARQGVQEGLGTTVEQWLRSKPGRAFNQEEALALGNTLTRVGREYDALQAEVLAAREGGTLTSEMQAQLADKALEFGTLAGVRAGSAAEAGRALRSFRTALTGAGASGASRERAIGRAFEAIGADPERFASWLDEFTKIAPENVQGRYQMLQALYKPTLMDNLTTWRYASMLSGWKTHLANTSSNFLEAGARPLVTAHAGYGRAAGADVRGMLNAIPEALAAAGQTFRTGVSRDMAGRAEVGAAGSIRPQALTSPLGRAVRAPIDLLSAADEFWKVVNFNGALRSEATRLAQRTGRSVEDIMTDGALLPGLHDRATQAARVATFTEDPGKFVNSLLQLRGGQNVGGAAVQFLLPFVRTPANIFTRAARLAASPVTETIGAGRALARGDTEAARMAGARAAIGAESLLGIAALVHNGFITGAGPEDATRRRELEATGWQPNSARVGDTYVSLANMGPIGQEAIWVANAYEAATQGKPDATLEDRINDGARRIGQVLVDTSYLSGIGDFFQSIQQGNLTGSLVGLAGGVAGSLVPYGSTLATVERLGDPTVRSRETPQDIVAGRLPGVSQLVPPEAGLYGEPRQSFEATAPGVLLPWRTSQAQQDPMANEVARLVQAGQSVPVPSIAPREEYAGERQTREQRAAVNQELGATARRYMEKLVASPDYQRLNDEQKAATLRRTLDASRQLADLVVGDRVARDPQAKADLEWARTPQYEGVRGTPDEVALQNLQVREAKNLLAEYRQRYGQDMGEIRLLREDRASWLLSQREALDTELQALRRGRIRERFGVSALEAERAPLLGAGNRPLLPAPGATVTARAGAFTAP